MSGLDDLRSAWLDSAYEDGRYRKWLTYLWAVEVAGGKRMPWRLKLWARLIGVNLPSS